jgi:dienelactone hydrolase
MRHAAFLALTPAAAPAPAQEPAHAVGLRFVQVPDPARIGVIGYSAGGHTALVAAGGVPDFSRMNGFCREQPDDMLMCAGGVKGRIAIRRPD